MGQETPLLQAGLLSAGAVMLLVGWAGWTGRYRGWVTNPLLGTSFLAVLLLLGSMLVVGSAVQLVEAAGLDDAWWVRLVEPVLFVGAVAAAAYFGAALVADLSLLVVHQWRPSARVPRWLRPRWPEREGVDVELTTLAPPSASVHLPEGVRGSPPGADGAAIDGERWAAALVVDPASRRRVAPTARPGSVPGQLLATAHWVGFAADLGPWAGGRRATFAPHDCHVAAQDVTALRIVAPWDGQGRPVGSMATLMVLPYCWRADLVIDTVHGPLRVWGPGRRRRRRLAALLDLPEPTRHGGRDE